MKVSSTVGWVSVAGTLVLGGLDANVPAVSVQPHVRVQAERSGYALSRPEIEPSSRWGFVAEPRVTPAFDATTAWLPAGPRKLPAGWSGELSPASVYLVQTRGPAVFTRERLQARGLEVLDYVPTRTFVVRGDAASLTDVAKLQEVRAISPFRANDRRVPQLEVGTGEHVHVVMWPGTDAEALASTLRLTGADVEDVVEGLRFSVVRAWMGAASFDALAANPDWYAIERVPDFIAWNTETVPLIQSGSYASGTTNYTLHNAGIDGTGQILTIMDSGLDNDHAHFAENSSTVGTPGSGHRKVEADDAYCSGMCDTVACSSQDHGTHVSGTALGNATDIGMDGSFDGVAPGARLIMQDIQRSNGGNCAMGALDPPTMLSAAAYPDARAAGSFVHSNSWGTTSNTYPAYTRDIDADMWANKNFLVLFAAGNAGAGFSTVGWPTTAKNIVSVGGHDADPFQDFMYGFSSRGPAVPSGARRRKPTVTAPATDTDGTTDTNGSGNWGITSAASDNNGTVGDASIGGADGWSGTSMATPAVSAAAILTRQYFMDGYYPKGASGGTPLTPSAALMRGVLMNAGRDMLSLAQAPTSNQQGYGRVVLDDALYLCGDSERLFVDDASRVGTGESVSYDVEVTGGGPLKINLAWTDRDNAAGTLVNDLDLTVTNSIGVTWRGGELYGGYSRVGGSFDRTNPDEMVHLFDPAPGTYTVTVTGFDVPMGEGDSKQPFAIVIRGGIVSVDGSSLGGPPDPPTPIRPMDAMRTAGTTPQLVVIPTDAEADAMEVQFQWSDDPAFGGGGTLQTRTVTGPIASGDFATYTILAGEALTTGTWYWRARARDPGGDNCWSVWSEINTIVVDTAFVGLEDWHQTGATAFGKSLLNHAAVSSTGAITLALDTNDALGASVTVSSTLSSASPSVVLCDPDATCAGSLVTDDAEETIWVSNTASTGTATVDLGASQDVDRIVLDFGNFSDANTPADFTVDTSADCSTYANYFTQTGGTSRRYTLDTATSVVAQCIRVDITAVIDPMASVPVVAEIEAYQFQTGTAYSAPIVLEDLRAQNEAWDTFEWSDTTPGASDVTYHIEYDTGGGVFALVPDADLAGNSAGFTTAADGGSISLAGLTDTTTYATLRIRAELTPGSSPSINDWTIGFQGQVLSSRVTNLSAEKTEAGIEVGWSLQLPTDVVAQRVQRELDGVFTTFADAADPPPFQALPGQHYDVVDSPGDVHSSYRLEIELADGSLEYFGPVSAFDDAPRGCACAVVPSQRSPEGIWLFGALVAALWFVRKREAGRLSPP